VRALWPEASPQRVDEILPLHAERDGFEIAKQRHVDDFLRVGHIVFRKV